MYTYVAFTYTYTIYTYPEVPSKLRPLDFDIHTDFCTIKEIEWLYFLN